MIASAIFCTLFLQALLATGLEKKACTPDVFPRLHDKGFCSNTMALLESCVSGNEITESKDCKDFDGSWCCYDPELLKTKLIASSTINEKPATARSTVTTVASIATTTTAALVNTSELVATVTAATVPATSVPANLTAHLVFNGSAPPVINSASLRSLYEDSDNYRDQSGHRDKESHRSSSQDRKHARDHSIKYREPFDWDWDREHRSRNDYDKAARNWVQQNLKAAWNYANELVDGKDAEYSSHCGSGGDPNDMTEVRNQKRGEILSHMAQWLWDNYPHSNKKHLHKAMLNVNAYEHDFLRDCLAENYDPYRGTCSYKKYSRPDQICNNWDYPNWGAYDDIGVRITDIWNYDGGMWRKQKYHAYPSYDGSVDRLMNEKQLADLLDNSDEECYNFDTTMLHAYFTQFITHDIIRSAPYTMTNYHGEQVKPKCCGSDSKCLHHSCHAIFDEEKKNGYEACLELSDNVPGIDYCHPQAKDPRNLQTAYIDGSAIYGANCEMANNVRSFRNGKLKVNKAYRRNVNLPDDPKPDVDECDADYGDGDLKCLMAGDKRVNQHPGLTAWHTVFLRLHNQIAASCADYLENYYLAVDVADEICYQETRRFVQAVLQNVFYRDHLPVELGSYVTDKEDYGLSLDEVVPYNPHVRASVWPEYTYAAGRLHTLVSHWTQVQDPHRVSLGYKVPDSWYSLYHFLHKGYGLTYSKKKITELLQNSLYDPEQCYDTKFVPELRQGWSTSGSHAGGLDMLTINLARGREFGIPWYTQLREFCGMSPIYDWDDLEGIFSQNCLDTLPEIYGNVKNIEGYVGMNCEKPMKEALVGPTSGCILQRQYQNLREGDRFFFDRNGFTLDQMKVVRNLNLGKILCMTTNLDYVTENIFRTPHETKNRYVFCEDYNDLSKDDLRSLWKTVPVSRGDYRTCKDYDPIYAAAASYNVTYSNYNRVY